MAYLKNNNIYMKNLKTRVVYAYIPMDIEDNLLNLLYNNNSIPILTIRNEHEYAAPDDIVDVTLHHIGAPSETSTVLAKQIKYIVYDPTSFRTFI
jgi:hypothetical protein